MIALSLENHVVILAYCRLVATSPKGGGAFQCIGKCVPSHGQFLDEASTRFDGDVEDPDGCVRQVPYRICAMTLPGYDLDGDSPIIHTNRWYLLGPQIAISGFATLQLLRQVYPQLHSHRRTAIVICSRHFRVHDSTASRHELQVTCVNGATIACEVLMVGSAGEHVGDGFLSAVRMIRKSGARSTRKVIEHDERAKVAKGRGADGAADACPYTFGLLTRDEGFLDCSWSRHGGNPLYKGF